MHALYNVLIQDTQRSLGFLVVVVLGLYGCCGSSQSVKGEDVVHGVVLSDLSMGTGSN